jgi:hypothetical protein
MMGKSKFPEWLFFTGMVLFYAIQGHYHFLHNHPQLFIIILISSSFLYVVGLWVLANKKVK